MFAGALQFPLMLNVTCKPLRLSRRSCCSCNRENFTWSFGYFVRLPPFTSVSSQMDMLAVFIPPHMLNPRFASRRAPIPLQRKRAVHAAAHPNSVDSVRRSAVELRSHPEISRCGPEAAERVRGRVGERSVHVYHYCGGVPGQHYMLPLVEYRRDVRVEFWLYGGPLIELKYPRLRLPAHSRTEASMSRR